MAQGLLLRRLDIPSGMPKSPRLEPNGLYVTAMQPSFETAWVTSKA